MPEGLTHAIAQGLCCYGGKSSTTPFLDATSAANKMTVTKQVHRECVDNE